MSLQAATLGLGGLLAATMIAALFLSRSLGGVSDQISPSDLTLYQIAMLAGGPSRVCDTALGYLTYAGYIEVRESTDRLVLRANARTSDALHRVEIAILAALNPSGVRPEAAMGAGRIAARQFVDVPDSLVISPGRIALADLVVLGGSSAVVVATAWWVLATDASTSGFVPLLAVLAAVVAAWWIWAGRPRLSQNGKEILEYLRQGSDSDLAIAAIGVTSLPIDRAMRIIALYGRDALTGGLSGLRKVMTGNPSPVPGSRSLGSVKGR
jgi:uncharacterized protein (TIGR04222 family)